MAFPLPDIPSHDSTPVQLSLSIPGFDFTPPPKGQNIPSSQPADKEQQKYQLTLSLDSLEQP